MTDKLPKYRISTTPTLEVLVLGYYNHGNLGDEQYKISIKWLLQRALGEVNPHIRFMDCDQLKNVEDIVPGTVVCLGGGDVLNTYFLDKLNRIFTLEVKRRRRYTLLALSVGIPYNDIFLHPAQRTKLEIFDAIFLRTTRDIPILTQYIGKGRVHYLPDTSCYVMDATSRLQNTVVTDNTRFLVDYEKIQRSVVAKKKVIGISLCRHIYHPDKPYRDNYKKIVQDLAILIYNLVKLGFLVVLVPFNTKPLMGCDVTLNKENDTLIQADVMALLSDTVLPSVMNIDYTVHLDEMLALYPLFHVMIPMRFHATLFCVYTGVPMIPIYTTKKIRNFLAEISWKYDYMMDKNEKDLPTKFDRKRFMWLFHELMKPVNYAEGKRCLLRAYQGFMHTSKTMYPVLKTYCLQRPGPVLGGVNLLEEGEEGCRGVGGGTGTDADAGDGFDIIPHPTPMLSGVMAQLYHKLQDFALHHGLNDFRMIRDPALQEIAVCIVSYYLTKSLDSCYNHGLVTKMFKWDYDFEKEWEWVLKNHQAKTAGTAGTGDRGIVPSPSQRVGMEGVRFNLDYIDQNDRSGAHRSGWKYVFEHLRPWTTNGPEDIRLDLYVDRTFHWKREVFKYTDIIPYVQPWMGVVHHTFDTTFSDYNNEVLLKCPEFQQSLASCRGLIVLSETLRRQFMERLAAMGGVAASVPVYVLTHPTETGVAGFDYGLFLANSEKRLLHVGGWLRNIFSFFQVELADRYTFMDIPDGTEEEEGDPLLGESPVVYALPAGAGTGAGTGTGTGTEVKAPSCYQRLCQCLGGRGIPVTDTGGSVPKNHTYKLTKAALKGKYMNNYFPTPGGVETGSPPLCSYQSGSGFVSATPSYLGKFPQNNWYRHMQQYITLICEQTPVLEYVTNDLYDALLTMNLVFLNLVDGSAINTLLECVVRCTPVIVNRHPAVVEVLGEDYPLYYTIPPGCSQPSPSVHQLLSRPEAVWEAHRYLCRLDKTPYRMTTFVTGLAEILRRGTAGVGMGAEV